MTSLSYSSDKPEKCLFPALLFLSIFFATSCQGPKKWVAQMDNSIYQSWTHSFEEDSQNQKVYRPAGYSLPPARGREGIEFRQGGSLTYKAIGPADVPVKHEGTWTMTGKNTMLLRIPGHTRDSVRFQISSVDKDRLIVTQ